MNNTGLILVTGATGTVGREVARQLVAASYPVRVASRGGVSDLSPLAEPVFLDLHQRESFVSALHGVDSVFLSTPLAEDMVEVAGRFIEAAVAADVRYMVRLSAFGVDREPPLQLGRAHAAVEQLLRDAGLEWTVLRPNSFMQNFITYHAASIREQAAFNIPQGNGRVSMVDVRDIAAVAARVPTETGHAGKVYELTGPEALDNTAAAAELSAALGTEIRYVDVPDSAALAALEDAGMPAWLINVLMELHGYSRDGYAAETTSTVSAILNRPPHDFARFAQDFAERFR